MTVEINTYLVQRLSRKPRSEFHARASQVFGGGQLQLSAEAWKLLQQVFDFHYMGAAEYEFGAIPKCLKAFVEDKDKLTTFEMTLGRSEVAEAWWRESIRRDARQKELRAAKAQGVKAKRAKVTKDKSFEPRTIYVLCRQSQKEYAEACILALAKNKVRTKCGSHFAETLDPDPRYEHDDVGWLELDHGFFFFIDQEVFRDTCKLFEVT